MLSRRGFIRVGAATVGSLALRPFGLLPALAQSSANYRALVCVFLFGGNDSNNTVIPMDDASFQAYTSIRGSLALSASELTPTVYSVSNAPFAFHGKLAEVASLFSSKELAVVANIGSLVQPLTRSQYQGAQAPVPLNLFSHSDQQLQWQTSIAQGNSPTGWAGRVADYLASQKINSSNFPAFLSVAGNSLEGQGVTTQPVAIAPGQSLTLNGFSSAAPSAGAFECAHNPADHRQRAFAGASRQQHDGEQHRRCGGVGGGARQDHAAEDAISHHQSRLAVAAGGADHPGAIVPGDEPANLLLLAGRIRHARRRTGNAQQSLSAVEPGAGGVLRGYAGTGNGTERDHIHRVRFQPDLPAHHHRRQRSRLGQPSLVLGGAVQGGQIYGQFPTFELAGPNDTDTRGRWIPTTSIDQYGATLCSWFGIPDSALATVFPNFANFGSQKLGFLG